ncbi:hypothetical protein FFLO_06696 [Filobasidium floriforme]|uniref:Uncharacterized protein n=1 Tax=Filobasidium floriforme TaxID=5210 RepID=A0A8K0NMS4_9TREE|nr:hypothetical protein FFLO_06696 [Filobasidium floriforme]
MSFTDIANSVTDHLSRLTSKSQLLKPHLKSYHEIWAEEAEKVGKALRESFESLETPVQRLRAAARKDYSQAIKRLKKNIRAGFKTRNPGVQLPHGMEKHLLIHWIERPLTDMLTPWDEPPIVRELVIEQRKHYFSGIHDAYRVIAVKYHNHTEDFWSHDKSSSNYHCQKWLNGLDLSNVSEARSQASVGPLDSIGVLHDSTVPEHSVAVNQSADVPTSELEPATSSSISSISP